VVEGRAEEDTAQGRNNTGKVVSIGKEIIIGIVLALLRGTNVRKRVNEW